MAQQGPIWIASGLLVATMRDRGSVNNLALSIRCSFPKGEGEGGGGGGGSKCKHREQQRWETCSTYCGVIKFS